jgi:hypothetical protein
MVVPLIFSGFNKVPGKPGGIVRYNGSFSFGEFGCGYRDMRTTKFDRAIWMVHNLHSL